MKKRRKWQKIVLVMISILTMLGTSIGAIAAEVEETEEGQVSGGRTVPDTAFEVVEDMGIGWNLGNSLDAINKSKGYNLNSETFWNNPVVTKELIDTVAAQGYGAIRVPVSWYNHIDENGIIDERWLARVAEVVNYCLDNDLYVIINVHHDAGMDDSYRWIYADVDGYETDCANLTNLWSQIATYFKDYDERLLFEATNEIMNRDKNWNWGVAYVDFRKVHDLDQEFINTVRATGGKNASRFLVLSTWAASSDSCQIEHLFYKSFEDTVDDHLIVSVHNYMISSSKIQSVIASLKTYSDKYGVPFILDEFGNTNSTALETRITATTEIVSTAKAAGITCFWWDNGGDYALFNRTTYSMYYPTLVEAMIKAAGIEKEEVHEHTVVVDEAIEATCTEEGKTEGSHCSVCNEVFVAQETIAKKEHTVVVDEAVAPTTETEGKTEGSHCSVCNEVIVAQEVIPKLTVKTGWEYKDDAAYFIKEDGSYAIGWEKIENEYYYFDSEGVMQTGWVQIGSNWYYLNKEGIMQTGWVKDGSNWYYLNEEGIMQTGWIQDGTNWYYLNSNGTMRTGWLKEGNNWYYLGRSGVMVTGWFKEGTKWYYMSGSGIMQVGWIKVGGTWYYLGNAGSMLTGWFKQSNVWYYLNDSGAMLNGWQQIKGKWYYFYSSGKMAANTKIGSYFVNSNGEWIK